MSSLDVLDYQVGLDAALARPGPDGKPLLEAGLRRQALKDVRRVVDAMAFRFALLDDRPLPEDLDYLRALEAVKPAERAAPVLARRRALYARVRMRRRVTTWTTLGVIALALFALVWFGTSEQAQELALVQQQAAQDLTFSDTRTFNVTPEMNRLHLDGTILVANGSPGVIEVRLVDPAGETRVYESYAAGGNLYLRENVYSPQPGEWTLLVDFLEARGSIRLTVDGVSPAR